MSWSWPNFVQPGVSSQPAQDALYRPSGLNVGFNVINDVAGTVPPVPQGNQGIYRGIQAFQVRADAASLRIFYPANTAGFPFQMYFPTERPVTTDYANPTMDGFACWRVTAMLAFDNPAGPLTNDLGIGVMAGAGTTPRGGGEAGMSLSVTDSQTISLNVCQTLGAGQSYTVNMVNPPDVRDWNKYEFRFIGATKQREAYMKAMVNDAVVAQLSWGAGTVLPDPIYTAGGGLGFRWVVGNRGGAAFQTVMYIPPGGINVAAAPTELDLL
jgi:hypothetical protein